MCAHDHADIYTVYTHTPPWPLSWHGFRPTCLSNWVNWRVKMFRFSLWKLLVSLHLALPLLSPVAVPHGTHTDITFSFHTNTERDLMWLHVCRLREWQPVQKGNPLYLCTLHSHLVIIGSSHIGSVLSMSMWALVFSSYTHDICTGWRNQIIGRKQNVCSKCVKTVRV